MASSANEKRENYATEREACLQRISNEPSDLKCRLKLARYYFQDQLNEFAVRELIEIKRRSSTPLPSVDRLLQAFGPIATPYLNSLNVNPHKPNELQQPGAETSESGEEDVLAEIDIEGDFGDALEELDGELDDDE